jgi:hypothetical protein
MPVPPHFSRLLLVAMRLRRSCRAVRATRIRALQLVGLSGHKTILHADDNQTRRITSTIIYWPFTRVADFDKVFPELESSHGC